MNVEAILEGLRKDGYCIIPKLLTAEQVELAKARIAKHEEAHGYVRGRNNFEGEYTLRVYSLAVDPVLMGMFAENPLILQVLDCTLLPNYLLSNLQSIRIFPGETLQPVHTDDAFYIGYNRPRPVMLGMSAIWALDDFTETNGATEFVPGSHLWGNEHPDDKGAQYVKAVMPAGSVIVFNPALWHRGGANVGQTPRLAFTTQYCQPWLRPQEAQLLLVPPSTAAQLSPRGRSLVGYSIHPPFIGQVDGKHPERLVDEASYRGKKGSARMMADRVLERPTAEFLPGALRNRM